MELSRCLGSSTLRPKATCPDCPGYATYDVKGESWPTSPARLGVTNLLGKPEHRQPVMAVASSPERIRISRHPAVRFFPSPPGNLKCGGLRTTSSAPARCGVTSPVGFRNKNPRTDLRHQVTTARGCPRGSWRAEPRCGVPQPSVPESSNLIPVVTHRHFPWGHGDRPSPCDLLRTAKLGRLASDLPTADDRFRPQCSSFFALLPKKSSSACQERTT